MSRSLVSKVERGLLSNVDVGVLERACLQLGADLDVRVRWRGEGLDRLLDEAHAELASAATRMLAELGWVVEPEVTFNELGERGSVDLLAWHPATRMLLIVELKSVVADAQATLVPLDRKKRLGRRIAGLRGWEPTAVSRLLVLVDSSMNRRRVERVRPIFDAAFHVSGVAVRRWLRDPAGPISGLLFLATAPRGSAIRGCAARQRVRRRVGAPERSQRHPRSHEAPDEALRRFTRPGAVRTLGLGSRPGH